MATSAIPTPPTKIDRVKVKVTIDTLGNVAKITCAYSPGRVEDVIQHLPTSRDRQKAQHHLTYYEASLVSLIWALRTSIPVDHWATAIGSEIIGRLGASNEAETELSVTAGGAYLALDNCVYKLLPVEIAPMSKAMSAVRRRVSDKAKDDADKLIRNAERQSQSIMTAAANAKAEADKLLAEAQSKVGNLPPKWAVQAKVPLQFNGALWEVGFRANIRLLKFIYVWDEVVGPTTTKKTKIWNAKPNNPVPFLVWVKLEANGSYNQRLIHLDYYPLPHVNTTGSCMAIAAAPKTIKNYDNLALLAAHFQTCMATVNLESLYTPPSSWHQNHQDALPDNIKAIVMAGNSGSHFPELRPNTITCDARENLTPHQQNSETWSAA